MAAWHELAVFFKTKRKYLRSVQLEELLSQGPVANQILLHLPLSDQIQLLKVSRSINSVIIPKLATIKRINVKKLLVFRPNSEEEWRNARSKTKDWILKYCPNVEKVEKMDYWPMDLLDLTHLRKVSLLTCSDMPACGFRDLSLFFALHCSLLHLTLSGNWLREEPLLQILPKSLQSLDLSRLRFQQRMRFQEQKKISPLFLRSISLSFDSESSPPSLETWSGFQEVQRLECRMKNMRHFGEQMGQFLALKAAFFHLETSEDVLLLTSFLKKVKNLDELGLSLQSLIGSVLEKNGLFDAIRKSPSKIHKLELDYHFHPETDWRSLSYLTHIVFHKVEASGAVPLSRLLDDSTHLPSLTHLSIQTLDSASRHLISLKFDRNLQFLHLGIFSAFVAIQVGTKIKTSLRKLKLSGVQKLSFRELQPILTGFTRLELIDLQSFVCQPSFMKKVQKNAELMRVHRLISPDMFLSV